MLLQFLAKPKLGGDQLISTFQHKIDADIEEKFNSFKQENEKKRTNFIVSVQSIRKEIKFTDLSDFRMEEVILVAQSLVFSVLFIHFFIIRVKLIRASGRKFSKWLILIQNFIQSASKKQSFYSKLNSNWIIQKEVIKFNWNPISGSSIIA